MYQFKKKIEFDIINETCSKNIHLISASNQHIDYEQTMNFCVTSKHLKIFNEIHIEIFKPYDARRMRFSINVNLLIMSKL